ncbi:MAG: hypothetical protein KJO07_24330 [Deltaproteobacteria bacterium]|nr:hypothetical protein [Deltaproteobacteria bacterium]
MVSWEEATQDGMVGATLHWRHLSNETETMARQLVFADKDGRLRVFRAECVLSADASAEPRQACQAALSSLQVAVGPELRKAIGELPPAAEPEADQPLELRKDLEPIPGSSTEISGPGTAKRTVLYSKKQKDESKSHRWLFLAGAVILVVGLYLTARTRGGHGDKTAPPADDSDDQTDDDGNGEGEGDNDDEGDR